MLAPRIPTQSSNARPLNQTINMSHSLAQGLKWAWLTPQTQHRNIVYNSVPSSGGFGSTSGALQSITDGQGAHTLDSRFGYVWNWNSVAGTPLTMFDTNTACPVPYNLKQGGTQRMTISVWIKNPPKNTAFVYMGPNNTGFRTWDLYCDVTTGFAHFCVNNTLNTLATAVGTTDLTVSGQWYLVTGVFTGTEIKVYINGRLEATTAFSGTIQDQGGGPLIGSWSTNTQIMTGQMASVMYWNRALGPGEIATLFNDPYAMFTVQYKQVIPALVLIPLSLRIFELMEKRRWTRKKSSAPFL